MSNLDKLAQAEAEILQKSDLDEQSFWDKVTSVAKKAGREVLVAALTLYYALEDRDTPAWARTIIVGALVYFVSPIDAVPDTVPVVGYADDLAVMAGAIAAVVAHIKPEHRERAENWVDRQFQ